MLSQSSIDADPITLAVIQAGLEASADEMFAVLRQTAMSPIIYEVLDVGTGVTDASGNLVSSGAGIPTFIGVLDKAVKRIIELKGEDAINDGDLFLTNDPGYGGVTHLNDMVVAMPVFFQGRLVAWSASIAHWSDVGGMVPGSMSADAVEITQEGVRVPAVRLFVGGVLVESVLEIIAVNSRMPEFVRGDLWAQVAASRRAASRIRDLVDTYGLENYQQAIKGAFAEGQQRTEAGLRRLSTGSLEIEEEQDDGAVWKATIEIDERKFKVDLRGNPAQQAAPYNTSRDGAVIAAQMIFKSLCDPEPYANNGSFRPLEVLTEPGTIFHATGSAPHGFYFETRVRLYDLLWQCVAQKYPDLLPAGHFSSICGTVLAGVNPDNGRRYTMVEPQMGGWGATSERDGNSAMFSACHGDTYNCPAEICEARYGIAVEHRRLGDKQAGKGRHAGGRGIACRYRLRGDAVLSAGFSRCKKHVWGLNGGEPGGVNQLTVSKANGEQERISFVGGLQLRDGDLVDIETASGGGWGKLAQ